MRFLIGQRIAIRGQSWEVTRAERNDLLEVRGVCGANRGRVARFFVSVEKPRTRDLPPLSLPSDPSQADGTRLEAVLLAYRIADSFGPDTLFAATNGRIFIEPFQLAPALRLLSLPVPRLLIADDVGLGKTVEACICIAELARRGRASRVLVVCPPNLTAVWRDHLLEKFGMEFRIFDAAALAEHRRRLPAHLNPWQVESRIITSADWAKQPHVLRALSPVRWDAVVLDECHRLAERAGAPSRRARLAGLLAARTEALIMLSATPHDGLPSGFASLMRWIDPSLVDASGSTDRRRAGRFVIRRRKTGVVLRDGHRFAERVISSIDVSPSKAELDLHRRVSDYALSLLEKGAPASVGLSFVASVLKKRLLSSPLALVRSLEARLRTLAPPGSGPGHAAAPGFPDPEAPPPDLLFGDLGVMTDPSEETRIRETETIEALLEKARPLTRNPDSKIEAVRGFLEKRIRKEREKVVVFTEYRDTLDWMREWFIGFEPLQFHGALDGAERGRVLRAFREPGASFLLLATDAAAEGIDLHERCSTLVHFELPWNPNRLEQRNGRIDRFGCAGAPRIHHPRVRGLLESDLLDRLHRKLDRIRRELGSTADVLASFRNTDFDDLLMRPGRDPSRSLARLESRIDSDLEARKDDLDSRDDEAVWSPMEFGPAEEKEILDVLERSRGLPAVYPECRRMLEAALSLFGGAFEKSPDPGVFGLRLPERLRVKGFSERIEGATFDRARALAPGSGGLEFLSPAHPVVREACSALKGLLFDADSERVCTRVSTEEGFTFVFLQRFQDGRGDLVEQRLSPVFVGRGRDPSHDPERDLWFCGEGSCRKAPEIPGWAARAFEECLSLARAEEERRRVLRARELEKETSRRASMQMELLSNRRRERLERIESLRRQETPAGLDLFGPVLEEERCRKLGAERRRLESWAENELLSLDGSGWVEAQEAPPLLGAWIHVRVNGGEA